MLHFMKKTSKLELFISFILDFCKSTDFIQKPSGLFVDTFCPRRDQRVAGGHYWGLKWPSVHMDNLYKDCICIHMIFCDNFISIHYRCSKFENKNATL